MLPSSPRPPRLGLRSSTPIPSSALASGRTSASTVHRVCRLTELRVAGILHVTLCLWLPARALHVSVLPGCVDTADAQQPSPSIHTASGDGPFLAEPPPANPAAPPAYSSTAPCGYKDITCNQSFTLLTFAHDIYSICSAGITLLLRSPCHKYTISTHSRVGMACTWSSTGPNRGGC